jgi:D-alanyl-D-alanine carboxypeptidase
MKKLALGLIIILILLTACSDRDEKKLSNPALENRIVSFSDSVYNAIQSQLPGMLIYASRPDQNLDFVYCKGFSNLEEQTAINKDMSFRIASNTKTFVVTLALIYADRQWLDLDASIYQWYPDIPQAQQITIRQLCNMTSGIYDYRDSQELLSLVQNRPLTPPTIDSLIAIAAGHNLTHAPGLSYDYTNTNTLILGRIIEKISGKTLKSEIENKILKPLKLNNSRFVEDLNPIERLMDGYGDFSGQFVESSYMYHPNYAWAAGSVVSNLHDMKIWLRALTLGSLLSPEMQSQRLNFVNTQEGTEYGLGIMRVDGFMGHVGGMPGYMSIAVYNPEKDCCIIIFYNSSMMGPSIYLGIHFYNLMDIICPELGINDKKIKGRDTVLSYR